MHVNDVIRAAFLLYPGAPPGSRPNGKYPGALKWQFFIPRRFTNDRGCQKELIHAPKLIYTYVSYLYQLKIKIQFDLASE